MTPLDTILASRETAPVQDKPQDTKDTTQVTAETTETEQATEQQPETQEGSEPLKDGKQPPIGAIRAAEREKATKRYTEQVAEFDKRLADSNAAWERRFTQLLETVKPKAEPKPAPDIFENPSGFVRHEVDGPLSEVRGMLMHNSRLIAETKHGDEKVNAADTAFAQAVETGKIDPADYHRVLRSPNVYDAAVKWHQRQLAQAEIGDDPSAYRDRVKAEILAELQAQNGQQQNGGEQQEQRSAPVMPSNFAAARNVGSRAGPAWAGPKPLNDIFKR